MCMYTELQNPHIWNWPTNNCSSLYLFQRAWCDACVCVAIWCDCVCVCVCVYKCRCMYLCKLQILKLLGCFLSGKWLTNILNLCFVPADHHALKVVSRGMSRRYRHFAWLYKLVFVHIFWCLCSFANKHQLHALDKCNLLISTLLLLAAVQLSPFCCIRYTLSKHWELQSCDSSIGSMHFTEILCPLGLRLAIFHCLVRFRCLVSSLYHISHPLVPVTFHGLVCV